ncbi:protein CopA/IncA [Escherichia coli]|nr:protein CopA/IncA [Escherichia coli]
MWIYRSQKSKNPDNLRQVWRLRRLPGPINRIANNSAMRGIVICPEKFKTSFCAHSFCAL